MSQSEEIPISNSIPTGSALHLGLHSTDPDPDPAPNPDVSPSDLNHSAEENEHGESNLEQQLQNLDLNKEEGDEEEEAERKDDVERQRDNDAGTDAAGDSEEEEDEKSENENGSENLKINKVRKSHYPVRPEAEDCAYYMKTGLCKFGSNCKFNHPVPRKNQVVKDNVKEKDESTEKPSQTECKYYLRTGGCKFGKACRYNHSRAKSSVGPILELNFLGLPIRQGEKECPYYMRNGSCKYGANCRFNHPDPTAARACDPSSGYGNGGSVSSQAASQVHMTSWSSPRTLNESAAYMPIMFAPTQGVPPPNPEWNGYQTTVYPPPERGFHPTPAYVMSNPSTEATVYTHHQPQMVVDEFPVRPGQPECSYFMKTGDCKFKSNCKYHHPKDRVAKSAPCAFSDKGLPLRPDQSICSHYSRYGICKFGPACKFDHSIQADPSTVSGLDQPPTFSNSAATEQAGIAETDGTDTAVQHYV
ncbi:LOW QUALITY PROTEIN: zinc finger CCCH domain-containing protein 67-like [Durio zibethinus]|uniref:LOW QUALITY PROTEIN: zinc finger CCCH domain-containing protein 67-like n=1 Tax=Durio zibethinus TaxID=66656 RepID=A0A6P5YAK5_DURZI|nr:LOW QUALITY PROTEIN: zinc finger CCCH domain-containing protein 67-like [Durio zibethinus]